jgi:transmembrane sensor
MNRHDAHGPATRARALDDVAGDWLARRVRGLSVAEQAEFARWRAADPRHAACFAELETTWQALDALRSVRLPDGRALDHDVPSAAAERVQAGAAVAPRWRAQPCGRGRWAALTLAAAAAVIFAFVVHRGAVPPAIVQAGATEIGGFEKLTLADGSILRLNTASAIEARISRSERRVTLLRGQASFEVARDPARPFVVLAGEVAVRAVGTAFNVRLEPGAVDVIVSEGKVRIEHATEGRSLLPANPGEPVLVAGRRVTIERRPVSPAAVQTLDAEAMARELAWQERRLEFVDTPLREVVAEFNRHNRHELVIADARLEGRRFGGSIRADNADAFVRLLEHRFGVKAEHRQTRTLLRLAE